MTKEDVSLILNEIGTLLELKGESSFRCNAYHNGARAISQLQGNLADYIAEGRLENVPGIGETLREKIVTLVSTGRLMFHEELKASIPSGLVEMLRIPGLGPKKVKALSESLGIVSVDALRSACESNSVSSLKGFGAKTQSKILEGIRFLGEVGNRVRIDQASAIAQELIVALRSLPQVIRAELCGSLRRRRETAKDIDLLASSNEPMAVMSAFVKLPTVIKIVAEGETKSSVVVQQNVDGERVTLNADLRLVRDEQFPFALHYFTGSKEHNIRVRQRAVERGLKLNEYELAGSKRSIHCKDEAALFAALELDWIEPELREDTGEVEAAAWREGKSHRKLPDLVKPDHIRGVFHNHTTWSDGANSLVEMAQTAKEMGFEYLGIADHSQSLTVANGLSPARVRQQLAEIDALNQTFKGFRILKGIESDILQDGSLDYDESILELFDYVVASVHSYFQMPIEDMTARIVKAMQHPRATMLGHATGRLLLKREGYRVDLDRVLEAVAASGKMIEINAQPMRLDLDWVYCRRAKSLGIPLVINPDAHRTGELNLFRYGVDVARRGWLEKDDVFNTKSLSDVLRALGKE